MRNLNIYSRKDGRFEGRVYLGRDEDGKRRYRSYYGATEDEVLRRYEIAQLSIVSSAPTAKLTVGELAAEWLLSVQNRVKESTLANYRLKLKKHIIPSFGSISCFALGSKEIYGFINSKIAAGLSVRYVSDILVLMKSLFKYAAREYGIKNVFDGIALPKKQQKEVRILTKDEESSLKMYISESPSLVGMGIALTMYTGLRIGELCALQWSYIDLKNRTLTVRKTIQRIQNINGDSKTKLVITEPKSARSRRTIPIPECMIGMLRRFKADDSCFLLTGGDKPMEPRALQYRFARLLKKLSLPHIHYHALRHRFSTSAIELGFDVKTLSEILGHSSVELTMRLYVHSSFERKRVCMDLFRWSD
ncbi:MAG: site-specific integrase [Ruminococcus sp.]|nr:site-specific integrase [Ruminococcus sp.]MBR1751010.1 site-specific integrase [Ruminococcus sp.]